MTSRMLAATLLALIATTAVAAPPKGDEAEKSADSGSKMICKRFTETGSLVKSKRICKEKRDWERERDDLRSSRLMNSCANQGINGNC